MINLVLYLDKGRVGRDSKERGRGEGWVRREEVGRGRIGQDAGRGGGRGEGDPTRPSSLSASPAGLPFVVMAVGKTLPRASLLQKAQYLGRSACVMPCI